MSDYRGEGAEPSQPRGKAETTRAVAATAGRGLKKGTLVAARLTGAASRTTLKAAHRASNAQGAGETGLGRLIEVHALSNAGDAAVTVGLAGTLFLSAQPGEAKGHVALFLVLTMLPFAVVAPLIGPLLDRYRHGRRWSMGATLALRGFLCWVLADAIERNSVWQFPAALAILVSSKAYLVTRSAATPRLLPPGMTLVKANGRMSLAGVAGAAIGGPIAGGAAKLLGETWAFRAAFLIFVGGTILAILLPAAVDSEKDASLTKAAPKADLPKPVVEALRANVGLRWISGFLTMFMAFLMKMHPLPGWESRATVLLGLVVGAAAVGNALGTVLGSVIKSFAPRAVIIGCLLADAVAMCVAAVHLTAPTAVGVGVVAGLGQQLGKLALDSLIQDHLAETVRTSGFARSETVLQLAWVLGGIFAVVIPTNGAIGMYGAATILVVWAVLVVLWNAGRGPALPSPRSGRRRPQARAHEPGDRTTPVPGSFLAHDGRTESGEAWAQSRFAGDESRKDESSRPRFRPQYPNDRGWQADRFSDERFGPDDER